MANGTFNAGHVKNDGREYLPLEYVEKREGLVRVRCGLGELDVWRRAAMRQGRSLSELMRDYINRGVRDYEKYGHTEFLKPEGAK